MLNISPDKVCYILIKAREFDEKVEPAGEHEGSNPSDDGGLEILEAFADDPTYEEFTSAIEGLNVDEQVDLVALAWMGRGDYTADEFEQARSDARGRRNARTAEYLAGIPLLSDYLEEALSELGYSVPDLEAAHL